MDTGEPLFPLRATTTAADLKRDARAALELLDLAAMAEDDARSVDTPGLAGLPDQERVS
jgi:hypothetical protein